jgi:SNF2 family DNA or RNA helicase
MFRLFVFDEKDFVLRFEPGIDATRFASLHSRVLGFPEQKWSAKWGGFLIPQTANNIAYLKTSFISSEYEIDEDASLVIRYNESTAKVQQIKTQQRWEYSFNHVIPECTYPTKLKPFGHQIVATNSLHNSEFFALLMEMGTGKTKAVIDEICWKGKGRILIVCPKSVISTWIKEFEIHATKPYFIKRVRSNHRGVQDIIAGLQDPAPLKVWITNYDRLEPCLTFLQKIKPNICVLDESTCIKSRNSHRTKAAHILAESCERRFILTGTPVANTLLDLWAQFQFLQPGVLGFHGFQQYKQEFVRFKKTSGGFEKLLGYKNVEELKARMATCSFTVKKKDCLDLPEKIYTTRYVEMGERQRDLYEQMLAIALADIEGNLSPSGTVQASVVIVQLLRLAQIACGFMKTMDGGIRRIPDGDVKLQAVEEIFEELPENERVIIWARFHEDIDQLGELLTRLGITYGCYTGRENDNEKQRTETSFAHPEGIRVLIGEAGSGGLGKTFIGTEDRPCTTTIYYSNDFSSLKRQQSEDRCHRIGMFNPVTYIDIVCEDSIEERITKVLQSKKELNANVQDMAGIRHLLLGDRAGTPKVFKSKKKTIAEELLS